MNENESIKALNEATELFLEAGMSFENQQNILCEEFKKMKEELNSLKNSLISSNLLECSKPTMKALPVKLSKDDNIEMRVRKFFRENNIPYRAQDISKAIGERNSKRVSPIIKQLLEEGVIDRVGEYRRTKYYRMGIE
jgi:hypothetical protein